MHRHNRQGNGNINLKISDKDNFLIIKHIKSDLAKINEKNISSNLEKIDKNKDNISSNLEKIDNIENNISKSYLKYI